MLRERTNIFLAQQISARQRGAVIAFIPDLKCMTVNYLVTDFTLTSIVQLVTKVKALDQLGVTKANQ